MEPPSDPVPVPVPVPSDPPPSEGDGGSAAVVERHDGLQAAAEATPMGKGVITVAILALLATLAYTNLPASAVRAGLEHGFGPAAESLGLNQDWSLFAPDPARRSSWLVAEVELTDGTVRTWRPPDNGEGLWSPYRGYRWRKWSDAVIRHRNRPGMLPSAARFAAGQVTGGDERVAVVRLIVVRDDPEHPRRPLERDLLYEGDPSVGDDGNGDDGNGPFSEGGR
jgi:hypothetical protein